MLRVLCTKIEQAHDGYCSEDDNYVDKEKTFIKTVPICRLTGGSCPLDEGNVELTHPYILNNMVALLNTLSECDYGTGYCSAKNKIKEIHRITYYVDECKLDGIEFEQPEDVFICGNRILDDQTLSKFLNKRRKIIYDDDDSDSESSSKSSSSNHCQQPPDIIDDNLMTYCENIITMLQNDL